MVDFIKFVEVRSFYIDLYGGNLFLPTACLPSGAPIQIYVKLLNFKDFYNHLLKVRSPYFRFELSRQSSLFRKNRDG